MGLEVLNKSIQVDEKELEAADDFLNISDLIIPFSAIFGSNSPPDIYSGESIIPFNNRDSKFQQILLSEFISK